MDNQSLNEKVTRLEAKMQELAELGTLKQMLREQRAEIASLRETLARKDRSVPSVSVPTLAEPSQLKKPDTTRRKMLKRMGLAVLAGGAALGFVAENYAPAEAKIIVSASTANVGAVVSRTGTTVTNITSANYGLIASPDDSISISAVPYINYYHSFGVVGVTQGAAPSIGVYGFSDTGPGVLGYCNGSGTDKAGVHGYSNSGIGVYGIAVNGSAGIAGDSATSTQPAILANNYSSSSGIAIAVQSGGISIKNAGTDTQTVAFVHVTSSSNIPASPNNYRSKIDNGLCNNRSNAMLFVTHINSAGPCYPFGVFYDGNYWYISNENTSNPMSQNLYFNVLIINAI